MDGCFRRLEQGVPPPVVTPYGEGEVLRYAERTIQQAIVQKLARYVSGLHAIDVLLLSGHLQEQAVIQRTHDEIGEDTTFVALGLSQGETGLHRRYLKRFWQEEFEAGVAPMESNKGRYQLPRKDILDYLEKWTPGPTATVGRKAGSVLRQAYSGYVHAASPQVMEMCDGDEFRFRLSGLAGSPLLADHVRDAWNYIYRGLLLTAAVAQAFGDTELFEKVRRAADGFEKTSASFERGEGKTA